MFIQKQNYVFNKSDCTDVSVCVCRIMFDVKMIPLSDFDNEFSKLLSLWGRLWARSVDWQTLGLIFKSEVNPLLMNYFTIYHQPSFYYITTCTAWSGMLWKKTTPLPVYTQSLEYMRIKTCVCVCICMCAVFVFFPWDFTFTFFISFIFCCTVSVQSIQTCSCPTIWIRDPCGPIINVTLYTPERFAYIPIVGVICCHLMWCDSCPRSPTPPAPFTVVSLGKVVRPGQKSQARVAFDMHSSRNLKASFSRGSGLTFDLG